MRVGKDLEHWQPSELVKFRTTAEGVMRVSPGRVTLDHGDSVDDPKSAQRIRAVPVEVIHAGTVAVLQSLKVAQTADQLAAGGRYADSGYVVVDALGQSGAAARGLLRPFPPTVCRGCLSTYRPHSAAVGIAAAAQALGRAASAAE